MVLYGSRLWEGKIEVGPDASTSLAFCLAPDSDHFLVGLQTGPTVCKVITFLFNEIQFDLEQIIITFL